MYLFIYYLLSIYIFIYVNTYLMTSFFVQLYEKIRRSEQKYRVALEVLSYHSQSSEEEFQSVKEVPVPEVIQNITQ